MNALFAKLVLFFKTALGITVPETADAVVNPQPVDPNTLLKDPVSTHVVLIPTSSVPYAIGTLSQCELAAKAWSMISKMTCIVLTKGAYQARVHASTPEGIAEQAVRDAAKPTRQRTGVQLSPQAIKAGNARKELILAAGKVDFAMIKADLKASKARYSFAGIYKHISDAVTYPDSRTVSIAQAAQLGYWAAASRSMDQEPKDNGLEPFGSMG